MKITKEWMKGAEADNTSAILIIDYGIGLLKDDYVKR